MKVEELLLIGATKLKSETKRLDSELLLSKVLNFDRLALIKKHNQILSEDQVFLFFSLINRRNEGEPISYITNSKEFWGLDFYIDSSVLIPRPETEGIVQESIKLLSASKLMKDSSYVHKIVDCGTGSGCIAVSLGKELVKLGLKFEIYAVEKSFSAMEVAKKNIIKYQLSDKIIPINVDWRTFFETNATYDLIISNPPYIQEGDSEISKEVYFEPKEALYAKDQGLSDIKDLISYAMKHSRNNSYFICEIGHSQSKKIRNYFSNLNIDPKNYNFINDISGFERLLVFELNIISEVVSVI